MRHALITTAILLGIEEALCLGMKMSPFRSGDENFPETEQSAPIQNLGLAYSPVDGTDSDDSGKDFVNVHLDFFPEDFVQAQRNWDDLISYKKSLARLREEKARNRIEEKIFQNQIDESSLDLLQILLTEGSFLQSLGPEHLEDSDKYTVEVKSDNGVDLRSRLNSRDKKWTQAHKDVMNQKGVLADFSWLEMVPRDVLAPILISNLAGAHSHDLPH